MAALSNEIKLFKLTLHGFTLVGVYNDRYRACKKKKKAYTKKATTAATFSIFSKFTPICTVLSELIKYQSNETARVVL